MNRKILFFKNKSFNISEINLKKKKIIKCLPIKRPLVFIFSENNISFLFFYISLLESDAAFFVLDNNTNQENLNKLIVKFNPNYLIIPQNSKIKINNNSSLKIINGYKIYLNNPHNIKLNKNLKLLLSTSGTTGPSKFVMLSKQNIEINTKQICKYLKIDHHDNVILNLPLHYSYGLSIFNTHFYKKSKIYLSNYSVLDKNFWKLSKKIGLSCFYGVPQNFDFIKRVNLSSLKLKKIKFMAVAGGKISTTTLRDMCNKAKKNSFNFFNMYGQTEASPRIGYSSFFDKKQNIEFISKAVEGGKLIVKNEKGRILKKVGSQGFLYYHGKNVMIGYAETQKDLFKNRKNNFLINTNDIAKIKKNNQYEVIGRSDKFIKINSKKINLNEVEIFLKKYVDIVACVENSNKINIFLEKKTISNINLKKKIADYTNLNQNTFNVIKLKKIPRTSNHKINYFKLKSLNTFS